MSGRRLLMLPVSDEHGASTRYRVLSHRPALEQAGFSTEVRYPLGREARGTGRLILRAADMLRDLYAAPAEDLLLIHRKTYLPGLATRLRREGRPVVFDMDDALDLPPPGRSTGAFARRRFRRNFEATVDAADLVLCGNRYLASRLPHGRCELLPTPVDTRRFAPSSLRERAGTTLGWVGYSDNLPYLEALGGPLRELTKRHPELRVIVVADRAPELPGVPVEFRRWRLEDEVRCFEGIRVGLMPLRDNPWTRGKCAFKAIQYMALGIPAVASPVGMNSEVIRDGENGFLPTDDRSWTDVLDAVLSNPALAETVGREGRRTVERRYSLEVVSRRLVGILSTLLSVR